MLKKLVDLTWNDPCETVYHSNQFNMI